MIAQRELEEERRRKDPKYAMEQLGLQEKRSGPDIREFEHADVIKGVYFTCELLGGEEAMTKPDLMQALEEFLVSHLSSHDEDTVVPAVLLLYSLNKKQPKETAIETIGKYLQNIIENPDEPKYRRIRLSNKAYQERVASVKGGREFLEAVGFSEKMEPFKEGENPEPFLVMPESAAQNTGRLISALEMLKDGQSVPIKISRETSVFALRENERIPVPQVPPDFYDLTAEEIRREQQLRTEELNRNLMLRTKEMRERDEKQRQYTYKYTLVRIRLPDRYVLQGTFGCYEPFSAIREYIAKHLANEAVLFTLRNPMKGSEPLSDETKTLAALGLAPAAVLHLDFDEPVDGPSLRQEYIDAAVPLTAH
ncbi:PUB domain protein [Oesophagostomum dentatum]|uniref:PUB domain protein n=1 Tax=Oesophagostomum dentatum TaxID=61180 RepID=A0A0B1SZH7_OESDE|nr:PUB domain protein [Oesophagostomum dentatum]